MLALARRQKHLLTAKQLGNLGYGKSTIHYRVAAGRLHPTPFAAVYSLAPPPLGRLETIKAAALACGHPSLPSHWSAAEVLAIAEPPLLPVHVTRPSGNGRRRKQIVLHRSVVPACDTAGRNGILCTSAARTILDLAALAECDELERILIAADSLRILNRGRLDELVAASSGCRGIKVLRSLLESEPALVRNQTEVLMLEICRHAALPRPLVNSQVPVVSRRGRRSSAPAARRTASRRGRGSRTQEAAKLIPASGRKATRTIRRGSGNAGQGRRRRCGLRP